MDEDYQGYERGSKESRMHPKLMMSVENMLNPVVEETTIPTPASSPSSLTRLADRTPPQKKQKVAKDAPVFVKGKPNGCVRYPPFESFADPVREEMASFNIHPPLQDISQYPRHIPYSSSKKGFQHKTGRDAFEVFQYIFEVSGHDQEYVVMWDYNVGLVRITPFFKCCGYAKTIPGKMLAANPGLKEICHSITGGALAAQGYWMPYDAARALAKTFCYDIRFALLPLFGTSFAKECLAHDNESYGHMIIERAITERSRRQADLYRSQESGKKTSEYEKSGHESPPYSETSRTMTPILTEPRYSTPLGFAGQHYSFGSQRGQDGQFCNQWYSPTSGFVDRERRNALSNVSDKHGLSYLPSPKSDTGLFNDRSSMASEGPQSIPHGCLPSPHAMLAQRMLLPTSTCIAPPNSPTSLGGTCTDIEDDDDSSCCSSGDSALSDVSGVSPKSKGVKLASMPKVSFQAPPPAKSGLETEVTNPELYKGGRTRSAAKNNVEAYKAAWMLWQLHMADSSLSKKRSKHRRCNKSSLPGMHIKDNVAVAAAPISSSESGKKRRAST